MLKLKLSGSILLVSFVVSLAACQSIQTMKPDTQCMTIKPVMKSTQVNERGGISIDRDDTESLMIYINELQGCAGVE